MCGSPRGLPFSTLLSWVMYVILDEMGRSIIAGTSILIATGSSAMLWSVLILPQLIDGPWSNRPRVAILEITGQIGVQVRAQEMVRTIKALREDRRVLAVLVDVDSPGGSAGTRRGRLRRRRRPALALLREAAVQRRDA